MSTRRLSLAAFIVLSITSWGWGEDISKILNAIHQVESGGQIHDVPRGDGGRARGSWQIWRDYWVDSKVPGKWADCEDTAYGRRVVIAYMKRYEPEAFARGDARTLAMLHHYGCNWRDREGDPHHYWRKIKAELD